MPRSVVECVAILLLVVVAATGCASLQDNPKAAIGGFGGAALGGLIAAAAGGGGAAIAGAGRSLSRTVEREKPSEALIDPVEKSWWDGPDE